MPWQHRRGFGGRGLKWVAKKNVRRPGSDPPLSSPGLGLAPNGPTDPQKKALRTSMFVFAGAKSRCRFPKFGQKTRFGA